MRVRVALGASVLLHAAVFVGLGLLPKPDRPAPKVDELTIVELVEVPGEPAPADTGADTRGRSSTFRSSSDDLSPETDEVRKLEDRPPSPAPRPETGESRNVEDRPPLDEPAPRHEGDGSAPSSKGLALSGFRGSRAGSTSPRLSGGNAVAHARPAKDELVGPARADGGEPSTPAEAGFVRKKDGRWIYRDPEPTASWTAELLPDGRLRFKDHLAVRLDPKGSPVGMRMPGLTDLANQARGVRFWMKRKRRLIARTEKMRLQMAMQFAEKNIERQLEQLHRDLVAIWTSNRPPRTRRGLLFDVWDDCDEHIEVDGGEVIEADDGALDELRRKAGARARARIVAFIRRHLPEDSPDAYSPEELRELNARRVSREPFDPYAT